MKRIFLKTVAINLAYFLFLFAISYTAGLLFPRNHEWHSIATTSFVVGYFSLMLYSGAFVCLIDTTPDLITFTLSILIASLIQSILAYGIHRDGYKATTSIILSLTIYTTLHAFFTGSMSRCMWNL
ncbi:MAG TPA: hypothetical protein VIM96_02640 [Pseudomonadales bacterium]